MRLGMRTYIVPQRQEIVFKAFDNIEKAIDKGLYTDAKFSIVGNCRPNNMEAIERINELQEKGVGAYIEDIRPYNNASEPILNILFPKNGEKDKILCYDPDFDITADNFRSGLEKMLALSENYPLIKVMRSALSMDADLDGEKFRECFELYMNTLWPNSPLHAYNPANLELKNPKAYQTFGDDSGLYLVNSYHSGFKRLEDFVSKIREKEIRNFAAEYGLSMYARRDNQIVPHVYFECSAESGIRGVEYQKNLITQVLKEMKKLDELVAPLKSHVADSKTQNLVAEYYGRDTAKEVGELFIKYL